MLRSLRDRALSNLAVIGSCLGVYVVLAIAFHWLIGPTVAKNPGAVVDKPAPAMETQSPIATSSIPATQSQLQPLRFVSKPQGLAAAAAPDATDVVPRKTPKKQMARKTVRRERPASRNPWDFGFGGPFSNNRSRPWF